MSQHPIRFGIQSPQQQVEWSQMRDLWQKADQWGYDTLWAFDHFYPIMGVDPAEPCFEGWTAISALSQHTKQARIGLMVTGNTYRNPCVLAKIAATLDHATAGRAILGIGAGWYELEHKSYGIDFKTIPGRLKALDEACQIIKGMFTQEKITFHGKHYDVTDAICSPKPVQKPHPPFMVAGTGEKVLLKIVAKYGDMWNTGGSVEMMAHLIEVMKRHGDAVGRDTDEIEKTIILSLCYGASAERERAAVEFTAKMNGTTPEKVPGQMMIGSKQECLDLIDRYTKVGVTHFIFSLVAPYMWDEIQRFAEEVAPAARRR
jgi:F420-dependent oxidoreductase-like protein